MDNSTTGKAKNKGNDNATKHEKTLSAKADYGNMYNIRKVVETMTCYYIHQQDVCPLNKFGDDCIGGANIIT